MFFVMHHVEEIVQGITHTLFLKQKRVLAGYQHKTEFLKVNPTKCIPRLIDNDFVVFESNAIVRYLAEKTGAVF